MRCDPYFKEIGKTIHKKANTVNYLSVCLSVCLPVPRFCCCSSFLPSFQALLLFEDRGKKKIIGYRARRHGEEEEEEMGSTHSILNELLLLLRLLLFLFLPSHIVNSRTH